MKDEFMPDLDCEERGRGARSFLGACSRRGDIKPIAEYEDLGVKRDGDLHFVVAKGVPDSTTTTSESCVRKSPTPRQPSVWYNAFGTDAVYRLVPEGCKDSFCTPQIEDGECDSDWQQVLLFDPKDTGMDIDINRSYKILTVSNTEKAIDESNWASSNHTNGNTPLQIGCDPQGNFILTLMEFRDNDFSQGCRRLPINELAWQSFEQTAGANTRNLQVMFILDIQNNGFQSVLEVAHKDTGRPINKLATWTRKDEPHYSRLLGTESVSGKVLQLTNHHNAVGNKRIAKIITATRFVKDSRNRDNGELTAALVLESIPEAELAWLRFCDW